jgi:hypothetical protein
MSYLAYALVVLSTFRHVPLNWHRFPSDESSRNLFQSGPNQLVCSVVSSCRSRPAAWQSQCAPCRQYRFERSSATDRERACLLRMPRNLAKILSNSDERFPIVSITSFPNPRPRGRISYSLHATTLLVDKHHPAHQCVAYRACCKPQIPGLWRIPPARRQAGS